MYSDNEEEWEDTTDDKIKDEDCQSCIKSCCINFKLDCVKGKRCKCFQDILKIIGILATAAISFYIVYRIKLYQSDIYMRDFLPTTTTSKPEKLLTWEDVLKRNLPSWYDKAKIGISITWGIYSVLGFGPDSEEFWPRSMFQNNYQKFINRTYGNTYLYPHLVHEFTAESFDPAYWARLFANSGAKYVLITSKDKDGYSLFPSGQYVGWDSVSTGPRRDILQELLTEVRQYDLEFGIVYAAYEWFNPLLLQDKEQNFTDHRYNFEKLLPDLLRLVNNYHPSLVYINGINTLVQKTFDFNNFLPWLYGHPRVKDKVVVANVVDNEHRFVFGKCDYPQAWQPDDVYDYKSEKLIKLDKDSMGFRHNLDLSNVMTTKEMLLSVISNIATGTNVVINIGPTKDGIIPLIYQKRLLELGRWLKVNGEAVYGTVPWKRSQDVLNGAAFYTCVVTTVIKKIDFYAMPKYLRKYGRELHHQNVMSALFVTFFKWPYTGRLRLRFIAHLFVNDTYQVEFLEQPSRYWNWTIYQNGMYREIEIQLPKRTTVTTKHAWVLRITSKPADEYRDEKMGDSVKEIKKITKDLPKMDISSNQSHHKYDKENVTSPVIHSSNQSLSNDPPVSPPG